MELRPDQFQVRVSAKSADAVRLSMGGDLDLAVAPGLLARVTALLPAGEQLRVELDLGAVDFVDLPGARALSEVYRYLRLRGHDVVLVADSPALVLLLNLLGCRS